MLQGCLSKSRRNVTDLGAITSVQQIMVAKQWVGH